MEEKVKKDCLHINLRYNRCCDTVECLDCGRTWGGSYPVITPIDVTPYTPQPMPWYPTTVCCTTGIYDDNTEKVLWEAICQG